MHGLIRSSAPALHAVSNEPATVTWLVAAIMTPSHAISPNTGPEVRAAIEGRLSPMGDYSHAMTVRQMVDLHAYPRSVH